MSLTERRISRGASLQGPLRHSLGGRKHDARHVHSYKFKITGLSVLAMAAVIAVVGVWQVEKMRITSFALHMYAPESHQQASDARKMTIFSKITHIQQDRATRQAAVAADALEQQQQHMNPSAPFPEELPRVQPQPAPIAQSEVIKPPVPHSAPQQQQLEASMHTAATPSAPFPQVQQQQQPDPVTWLPQLQASPAAAAPAGDLPTSRLLLSTHSRLMWYFPDSEEYMILHEGEGVHYGGFPGGEPGSPAESVWTAIRPHNWRPTTNKEYLVEINMSTGAELRRVMLPSRFTHDVVRTDDSVFVCDTGNGRILQLSYPDMTPVRSLDLFTLKDHPNTLAPLGSDNFLVMLHNLGQSDIVRINISSTPTIQNPEQWLAIENQKLQNPELEQQTSNAPSVATPAIIGRVQRVGEKAHGLVPWQGAYIMLDSNNGALMALDLTDAGSGQGYKLHKLWQAPEKGVFLKGLAVVDDIAYFGISPQAPRSARDDPASNNDLAAVDLITGNLLWRRTVPTAGLLNTISAPHLSVASTYLPSYTGRPEADSVRSYHSSPEVVEAMQSLTELGYPSKIGGYWSSGLPFLDVSAKGTKRPWEAGLQLPLIMLDISELQAAVAALPTEAWTYEYQAQYSAVMAGREGNQNAFKPGVQGIVLLFSANDGTGPVFKFPAYDYFKASLGPILEEVLGKRDMQHIIRLQLALMKPGVSDIKIHVDSGGYAIRGHRLHIPVFTHPEVSFDVCPHRYVPDPNHHPGPGEPQRMLDIQECFKIPTLEGFVFELNNRAAHKVSNLSPVERVHVVLDICEEPHPRVDVPVGTVCDYDMEKGLICKYPDGLTPAIMTPATYIDPAAAAAERTTLNQQQQEQLKQQQTLDNGTGYLPNDDSSPASYDDVIRAPVPPADTDDVQVSEVVHDRITNPDAGAAVLGSSGNVGQLIGTIRNGHTSTWITEAMHGSPTGLLAV